MKALLVLLLLALLQDAAFAAEESCANRCGTFDQQRKCQCDSMCVYYGSCCSDFNAVCPKKTRGDTFAEVEDVSTTKVTATTTSPEVATAITPSTTSAPTTELPTPAATTAASPPTTAPTPTMDPDADKCSGRPFDAFLQLKNGSTFAFRGQYFFELDEDSVLPGYPKLIQDVWGMAGPIDAAFTRINCQGKTYIFKGSQYWRFDGDLLDEDYPRDISVGFDNVPNNIDAAFALPAPNHRGRERAYFFKGDQYYQYEFSQQPSHAECVQLVPSLLFSRYAELYEPSWESLLLELFGGHSSSQLQRGRLISRDWSGFKPPVDAAIVGQVYRAPRPTLPPVRRRGSMRKRPSRRQRQRRKNGCSLFSSEFILDYDWSDWSLDDYDSPPLLPDAMSTPAQHVYFFKKANYYRVNLKTKRVDRVSPPYPRPIATYWLGCQD
ncbi:vitronectin b isoform X2 [Synchiropus splendidus]|uniref:vitronectin b isoform X2 n=1 Tax=Synchiropus splendidus TaxID=270530 RepID=UPI00237EE373|nr:vitronectin b isoform X2 [Synchiropus splendidus]